MSDTFPIYMDIPPMRLAGSAAPASLLMFG
jgi:hypothetical protein